MLAVASLALARATVAGQPEPAVAPSAPAAPAAGPVTIEISGYALVFAQLRLNGQQVRALIDTRSSSVVRLSTRLARELKLVLASDPNRMLQGLDGRRMPVQRAIVDTLAIGESVDRNMSIEVAADRIESIAAQVGTPFDAILGWGYLSRRSFVLDYRNRVLRLSDGPLPELGKRVVFAYSVVSRLPLVAARWGDKEIKLLFDTGAPMCNIDTEFAQVPAGQIVSRELTLGGVQLPLQWRAKDLSVTRNALGAVGSLGNNLLGDYAVHVNTVERMVTLA